MTTPATAAGSTIGLLGEDLIFQSRLSTVARWCGGKLVNVTNEGVSECRTVFVDLNAKAEERLQTVARWRADDPDRLIIGFCHHEKADLRAQAMEAGASEVITNGSLDARVRRLFGRQGDV